MATNINSLIPKIAIHPGEILKDELDERKITQTNFASETGIALSQLNEIIKGKRNITVEIALILEKLLDIEAPYWMNLQSSYELDLARINKKTREKLALIERWNIMKSYVPISFFRKQGVLRNNIQEDEQIIKDIYNASSIDDIIMQASKPCFARFKKSTNFTEDIINIVGWVKLVEHYAKNKEVQEFIPTTKTELIEELKKNSLNKNLIENTEKILSKHGIKLIVQEKPESAPIDGIAFWTDNNPTIGVTIRHKRIDNFLFTILHELGHIYLHLINNKKKEFIDNLENNKLMEEVEEKEANKFAADNLINEADWDNFVTKYFTLDDSAIEEFANELKIHPAIVRGRLCHEQNQYFNKRTSIDSKLI